MQGTALIVNGTEDHVHMLVRIRPVQSVAEVVRIVKRTHLDGSMKNGAVSLRGRQDMEHSASANLILLA
jgi:REP element-mobilizing transposase RayT